MRIAYLFQSSGIDLSESRAAQIHMYNIVKGLRDAGHQIVWAANVPGKRVVCAHDPDRARDGNLQPSDFCRLGLSGRWPFIGLEKTAKHAEHALRMEYFGLFDSYRMLDACRRNLSGMDVYHERYNLMGVGGVLASRAMGIPLVLEVNADPLAERDCAARPLRGLHRLWAKWSLRFAAAGAARIVCVSDVSALALSTSWGVPAARITVLPNAADVVRFGADSDPALVRRSLGLFDEPLVIFVGGFYSWHDTDTLIDSFGSVVGRFPRAKLLMVGDGPKLPEAKQSVTRSGLGKSVLFAGAVPHDQVAALLSAADVAVALWSPESAQFWQSPLKLYEYMAAAKAIVASRSGQVGDVIEDGHLGLLVEPHDVRATSEALVRLLGDSAERARLGANARRRAVNEHSWANYIRRLEGIYETALESAR